MAEKGEKKGHPYPKGWSCVFIHFASFSLDRSTLLFVSQRKNLPALNGLMSCVRPMFSSEPSSLRREAQEEAVSEN